MTIGFRLGSSLRPFLSVGIFGSEVAQRADKHTVIGSMDDLNAATVEDVAAFFKTYYAPNNAVLTLVGDFRTADALKQIKKEFRVHPATA